MTSTWAIHDMQTREEFPEPSEMVHLVDVISRPTTRRTPARSREQPATAQRAVRPERAFLAAAQNRIQRSIAPPIWRRGPSSAASTMAYAESKCLVAAARRSTCDGRSESAPPARSLETSSAALFGRNSATGSTRSTGGELTSATSAGTSLARVLISDAWKGAGRLSSRSAGQSPGGCSSRCHTV
jgi:hypothetical protein